MRAWGLGVLGLTLTLISPFQQDRMMARRVFREGDFIEIFVDCPIEQCIERDPKGLYRKAQAGVIREFTGISSPYEPPVNPEITINTAAFSVDECVEQVMQYLKPRLVLDEVTV